MWTSQEAGDVIDLDESDSMQYVNKETKLPIRERLVESIEVPGTLLNLEMQRPLN